MSAGHMGDEHIEAVARIVAEYIGYEEPVNPHGWRCADKTRYPGPCGCNIALAEDILTAIHTDRQVRAAVEAALNPVRSS